MTQAQIDQVERACERATVERVTVLAQGRMKSDNSRFFLTNSVSRPGGYHVVTWRGSRLICDCQGSERGYICKHAGAVRMHLEHMASRAQAQAERVEAALQLETRGSGYASKFSIFK